MDAGSPRCGLWKKVEICSIFTCFFRIRTATLDSGIDVGQVINVGPGTFGKKNKHSYRALNNVGHGKFDRKPPKICKVMIYKKTKLLNSIFKDYRFFSFFFQDLINIGRNMAVGLIKKSKIKK